jgi:hypothetical protein
MKRILIAITILLFASMAWAGPIFLGQGGGSAGSGDVATDAIWDAAGDTVYGTGANTGARLAKGTAYQLYMINSGATAPEWTSTLGATGTRLAKGWFTNLEITNAPTINGAAWTTILQPLHASLTSIAGLTETNGGLPYGTADNAYAWLAAGATGKVLIAKGAAAPEWTPYTFPATVPTVGKVLISDGTNLIGSTALGTAAYAATGDFQAALTYPVTGVASPTAGYLTKWGATGNAIVDGPKLGTLTDAKWCSFSTAGGLACTETIPQPALSLLKGTYADGNLCTYASSGTLLNCNTAANTYSLLAGSSSLVTVGTLSAGNATAVVDAASTSAAGKIKTATSTTVNTGTATDEAVTPDALAGSNLGSRSAWVQVVAADTDCAAYAFAGVTFVDSSMNGMNLVDVLAGVVTPGTTGTMTVNVSRTRVYTLGDSTTQFDITRPAAPDVNTTRYTYDGTGTDPGIADTLAGLQAFDVIDIGAQNFNAGNNAVGQTITAVGANYFEITLATGTAETDKTIGTGFIRVAKTRNMLSTNMSIDSQERSTLTAATPAVINTSYDDVATGDLITSMIETVHSGTAAKGLYVVPTFRLP